MRPLLLLDGDFLFVYNIRIFVAEIFPERRMDKYSGIALHMPLQRLTDRFASTSSDYIPKRIFIPFVELYCNVEYSIIVLPPESRRPSLKIRSNCDINTLTHRPSWGNRQS